VWNESPILPIPSSCISSTYSQTAARLPARLLPRRCCPAGRRRSRQIDWLVCARCSAEPTRRVTRGLRHVPSPPPSSAIHRLTLPHLCLTWIPSRSRVFPPVCTCHHHHRAPHSTHTVWLTICHDLSLPSLITLPLQESGGDFQKTQIQKECEWRGVCEERLSLFP
jgi:hypothetical protein